MLLTPAQQKVFWRLWSGACSVQGWLGEEKEDRRREALEACGFRSLKEVDRTRGFDRVKGYLQRLQYLIDGGREAAFPDVGEMRRHAHLIRTQLIPGIASRIADPAAYVAEICRDKWGLKASWETLADDAEHGPERMKHLLYTLSARLHAMGGPLAGPSLDKPLQHPLPCGPAGQQPPRP